MSTQTDLLDAVEESTVAPEQNDDDSRLSQNERVEPDPVDHEDGERLSSANGRDNGQEVSAQRQEREAGSRKADSREDDGKRAFFAEAKKIWRRGDRDLLRSRHQLGKLVNDRQGPPTKNQRRGDKTLRDLAEALGIDVTTLYRVRLFAHFFKSVEDLQRKHPEADTWTKVKDLLSDYGKTKPSKGTSAELGGAPASGAGSDRSTKAKSRQTSDGGSVPPEAEASTPGLQTATGSHEGAGNVDKARTERGTSPELASSGQDHLPAASGGSEEGTLSGDGPAVQDGPLMSLKKHFELGFEMLTTLEKPLGTTDLKLLAPEFELFVEAAREAGLRIPECKDAITVEGIGDDLPGLQGTEMPQVNQQHTD